MNRPFKILLATDYSESSLAAERYAFKMAQDTGSFLIVMHVCDKTKSQCSSNSELLLELRKHIFQHIIKGHFAAENLSYECIVRRGDIVEQISNEANEMDVDFIITAVNGSGDSLKSLGRTSRFLMLKARVPVIAVPKKTYYNGIKRVAYITGNRDGELPVISHLSNFCKDVDADLTILYLSSFPLSPELMSRHKKEFATEIRNKISYTKIRMEVCYFSNLTSGLNSYCIDSKTDLLVLSPERPYLFEKIYPESEHSPLTYIHNKVPLFTIPDSYSPDYSWYWRSLVPNRSAMH
jgi:nucleotide-binding universal stress UspA family protein